MSTKYKVDPLVVFPEVEQLLYEVSWQFARAYPIPFEECKSESFNAFMHACTDYDASKGMKFSSWARYWAWCKLKDLVMKRSGERLSFTDEIHEDALTARPMHSPSLELIEDLGADAKTLIALFLEAPAELCAPHTTHMLIKRTKKLLNQKAKWDSKRFDNTFETLRARFHEAWAV